MPSRREFPDLDSIDRSILDILQTDARDSFTKIGQQVGLSSSSVAERIRRLEESGVILGYHAQVAPAKAGFPITSFLLAKASGSDARVREAVQARSEVLECFRVTGDVSFVLKVVVTDVGHLEELIDALEKTCYITTLLVLSTTVKRDGVPLHCPLKR